MDEQEPRVIQFESQPVMRVNPISRQPEQGEMMTVLREDGRVFRMFTLPIPPHGTNWFEIPMPIEGDEINPIAEEEDLINYQAPPEEMDEVPQRSTLYVPGE